MAGLIDNRKRLREDDYNCDSTPLSKRINNLHLSNNHDEHSNSNGMVVTNNSGQNTAGEQHIYAQQQTHSQHSQDTHQQIMNEYNPELNERENPFYYLKNKLLHDLHFERLKRCET